MIVWLAMLGFPIDRQSVFMFYQHRQNACKDRFRSHNSESRFMDRESQMCCFSASIVTESYKFSRFSLKSLIRLISTTGKNSARTVKGRWKANLMDDRRITKQDKTISFAFNTLHKSIHLLCKLEVPCNILNHPHVT